MNSLNVRLNRGMDWLWVDRHNPANDKAIPDLSRLPAIVEHGL